jgi:hypothetical protein
MTEGEIDTLSEALGDETGSRAKRRRQIEEMTIEDLEAEIWELKPLEAWECRKARQIGQILINGRTVKGKIGATASHSMFLSGGLDDDSRCEVGMVTLPDGKVLNGLAAQGLYEITLREAVRLNKLTGSLTLTLGVQARAADKSIVDSLEGTVVWEYDSMACP